MEWGFSNILVALLALLLVAAAVTDLRARTISNRLNAAIALGAVLFWFAAGLGWGEIGIQVAAAAGVFLLFALLFALGAMGGGDVKMAAALALWLPPGALITMLVIMSIAGGALTLAMLIRHKLRRHSHALEIPYGVAIAFAGLWLISERFLYQFV